MKVFGCVVLVLIPSQKHCKLEEKSKHCIFIGYCLDTKAYKLYNHITHKVVICRDVVFRENTRWEWQAGASPATVCVSSDESSYEQPSPSSLCHGTPSSNGENHVEDVVSSLSLGSAGGTPLHSSSGNAPSDISLKESPPKKRRQISEIYNSCSFALNVTDLYTYEEAIKIDGWRDAMIK